MIRFRCSHCKKKFGVPDDYAGHRIRCNTCGRHTIVPDISTEPANVPVEFRPLPNTDQSALYDDKTDEDMVLSLSREDRMAATDQLVASKPSEDGREPALEPVEGVDGDTKPKTADRYPFNQSKACPELAERIENLQSSINQEVEAADPDVSPEVDGQTNSSPPPEDTPLQLQFQSFHHYQPPPSESRINKSDLDEPDPKNSVSELLKRCCPEPETDKIERAVNILSNIACIGPVFFIFIIFAVFFITAHNESPRAIKPPFGIPDTGPITGPVSFLAAFPAIRHAFYICTFGISPLALIAALYLVFRYRQDIPKSLYFVICVYGLILFVFLGA